MTRNPLILTVAGRPAPKGSLRHVGHGRLVEQVKGSAPWRQTVASAAREEAARDGWTTWDGPAAVSITVLVPQLKKPRVAPITRSSGDADKHARNVLDALVDAGVLADDSQVVRLVVRKQYSGTPGAYITVAAVEMEGL